MSLINISNLTFAYDGSYDYIFENVSFQIDSAWRLGFTGRNGRGKTTFLKLLMGKLEYRGTITASVSFDYFPFEIQDTKLKTHAVVNSIIADYQEWELDRELNLLGLSSDSLARPLSSLSLGEQTKLLLAVLFLKENNFLLIDEPTNHLDSLGRQLVSKYLRSKSGFILVSHDRAFLDNSVDHILSINKANIDVQKGNFSSWLINKQRQDQFELSENAKLQKQIEQLRIAAQRTSEWSDKVEKTKRGPEGSKADKGYIGHKAAKMMKRSKSIDKRQNDAITDKSKLLKNLERIDDLRISPLTHHSSRLMELSDIAIYYEDKLIASNINLSIEAGDRILLAGQNGSGKSSIIKLICEENINYTGSIKAASKLIISYVPQDTSTLKGKLPGLAEQYGIDLTLLYTILRKLDFNRDQFDKDMQHFSAGQKKKVLLARSLCERAHLYVWDEPLNYIDVFSRMQIEELLLEYQPTLLFVEHDQMFSQNIATKSVRLG